MTEASQNGIRPVVYEAEGMPASDGAGVQLTRMIGTPRLRMLDPFLMLDLFGSDRPQDYLAGFPEHPHRGFETVTYMLAGRMRHADNKGHGGVIETGGVQWMTAGSGLLHSEMPEQEEGLMKGFQLWINLPARLKMTAPKYQEFPAGEIPEEARDGARLKVIAGETSNGTRGPIRDVPTEARYFDIALQPGATLTETLPAGHTCFLVVYEGAALVAGRRLPAIRVAVLGEGERVVVEAGEAGASLLLIAGRPLGEPVAWAGPFVMNTQEELQQAMRDYQQGRF